MNVATEEKSFEQLGSEAIGLVSSALTHVDIVGMMEGVIDSLYPDEADANTVKQLVAASEATITIPGFAATASSPPAGFLGALREALKDD